MKRLLPAALLTLSACATAPTAPVAAPSAASPLPRAGLERVLGQDAAGLVKLFGPADADYREGVGRKLQFESAVCVLDAYLYPARGGEPRVTHLDARQPDGGPIDRASCVGAMTKRAGAR